MNDFTKDELVKLKLAINILYDHDGLLETKRISYRIQSMIDSYCEHKYVLRCHDSIIYCPYCGKELG